MSILEDALDSIEKTKDKESSGSGGWIGALVAGILVVVVTAVLGFVAWKRGKELAKLKHEKAVAEEDKHQAEVDAKLAASEHTRAAAMVRAEEAQQALEDLREMQQRLEEDHREARKRIDEITSWDDVDTFTGDPG